MNTLVASSSILQRLEITEEEPVYKNVRKLPLGSWRPHPHPHYHQDIEEFWMKSGCFTPPQYLRSTRQDSREYNPPAASHIPASPNQSLPPRAIAAIPRPLENSGFRPPLPAQI